jgi:hypothetical protein
VGTALALVVKSQLEEGPEMKSTITALALLVLGFVLGSFFRPATVRAERWTRVEKVNLTGGHGTVSSGQGVAISCVSAGDTPECYVLTQ